MNDPRKRMEGTLSLKDKEELDPQDRSSREEESREATARPTDTYKPEPTLPVPKPQNGYVFRWIRTGSAGHMDNRNVSKKFREGWVAVKAEDHPELMAMSDRNSQFEGNVEVGGLLLCKAPAETMKARQAYYSGLATQQLESVDRGFMNDQHENMPKYNESTSRTSRSKFGSG